MSLTRARKHPHEPPSVSMTLTTSSGEQFALVASGDEWFVELLTTPPTPSRQVAGSRSRASRSIDLCSTHRRLTRRPASQWRFVATTAVVVVVAPTRSSACAGADLLRLRSRAHSLDARRQLATDWTTRTATTNSTGHRAAEEKKQPASADCAFSCADEPPHTGGAQFAFYATNEFRLNLLVLRLVCVSSASDWPAQLSGVATLARRSSFWRWQSKQRWCEARSGDV